MTPVAVIVLFAVILASCDDDDKHSTGAASSSSSGLGFRSTTGKGVIESPADTFHIPACGSGKLGYITKPWRTALPRGAVFWVEFSVTASSDARIVGAEPNYEPGRAALHFQRDSEDSGDRYALDGKYYDKGYRQWSHVREQLTPGAHVFTEILTGPDRWTGGGTQTQAAFDKALADPAYAGITLSGAQSAGHGVCMASGTASITITRLTVN